MLKKLFKYDFIASNRYLWIGYVVVLGFALLEGLIIRSALYSETLFGGVSTIFCTFMMVMLSGALIALTYVIIFVRFYRNLLGGEGYLMNTLPVHTWELIVSKLANAVIQIIFSYLVLAAAAGLIWLASGVAQEEAFNDLLAYGFTILRETGWSAVLSALTALIGALSLVLDFYAACALGQLLNSHRVLFSLLFFVGIQLAEGLISGFFSIVSVFVNANEDSVTFSMNTSVPMMITNLLFAVAAFIVTEQLLRKKLNLE